jgi:CubicO group peptidase (beta-lactamase class C family)
MSERTLSFSGGVNAASASLNQAAVNRLAALFDSMIHDQKLHPSAQMVFVRRGQVVLDRSTGVDPDTPYLIFSASKPFTAVCALMLVSQGKIALDAPIARYWPEFGCKGKETATIRHAFCHQAGIPTPEFNRQVPRWPFWGWVTRTVAGYQAVYPPGERIEYHSVNFGWILGEVVRRVSGMPFADFLRLNLIEPLGLKNTYLPIPAHMLRRSAGLISGASEKNQSVLVFGLPVIRRSVIPAATVHSTARDLAVFYQMLLNGGEYAGRRFVNADVLDEALSLMGDEYVTSTGGITHWGLGFQLGGGRSAPDLSYPMGARSSLSTFGHFGLDSVMAWADRQEELILTFTCSRLLVTSQSDARWRALSDAAWETIS